MCKTFFACPCKNKKQYIDLEPKGALFWRFDPSRIGTKHHYLSRNYGSIRASHTCKDLEGNFRAISIGFCGGSSKRWLSWLSSQVPSRKRLHNYGKSQFLMGKSTINGQFQYCFNSYISVPQGKFYGTYVDLIVVE